MRGTFVADSCTFQIEIEGESWRQGDDISVRWNVTGAKPANQKIGLALALIDLRKIKKNDPKGIQLIEAIEYAEDTFNYEYKFALDQNASISDGTWTVSIVCGDLNKPLELKRLDLTITAWERIEEIITLIENFKRFKMKTLKNKKSLLDAKFSVPTSKEYGAIEGLNIHFTRPAGEQAPLSMDFLFKTKKLTYSGAGVETTKATIKIERKLIKKDYCAFGDSLNQEKLLGIFDEVFAEVSRRTRL
jgi:hypothetical protein